MYHIYHFDGKQNKNANALHQSHAPVSLTYWYPSYDNHRANTLQIGDISSILKSNLCSINPT